MAAGEYVSVHSQADTEQAELELERAELKTDDKGEHKELAAIYVARGLDPSLAKQVAQQLMAHDALGAHARDELGISETLRRASRFRLRWRRPPASRSELPCLFWSPPLAPQAGSDPSCRWNFAGVPRASRRVGGARGRRGSDRWAQYASRSGARWRWR